MASSFTSHNPLFRIFSMGECNPSQFSDDEKSSQDERVFISNDSIPSLFSFVKTSKIEKEKFSRMHPETSFSTWLSLAKSISDEYFSRETFVVKSIFHCFKNESFSLFKRARPMFFLKIERSLFSLQRCCSRRLGRLPSPVCVPMRTILSKLL